VEKVTSDIGSVCLDPNRLLIGPEPHQIDVMGKMILNEPSTDIPVPPAPFVTVREAFRDQPIGLELRSGPPVHAGEEHRSEVSATDQLAHAKQARVEPLLVPHREDGAHVRGKIDEGAALVPGPCKRLLAEHMSAQAERVGGERGV